MNGGFKNWAENVRRKISSGYRKVSSAAQTYMPDVLRTASSIFHRTSGIILLCAAALILMELIENFSGSAMPLIELIKLLLVLPVSAAMTVYAVDAGWEHRNVTIKDALHLVRIRIKPVLLTGVVVWLLSNIVNGIVNMLIAPLFVMLSAFPLLGIVFALIGSAILWGISTIVNYIAQIALTAGMMAMIDGLSGRAQFEKVVSLFKNGGHKFKEILMVAGIGWICAAGIGYMFALAFPVLEEIVMAIATICTAVIVSVAYLRQRDGDIRY